MNRTPQPKLQLAILVLYPFRLAIYMLTKAHYRRMYKREYKKMRSTFQRPLYSWEDNHLKMRHSIR